MKQPAKKAATKSRSSNTTKRSSSKKHLVVGSAVVMDKPSCTVIEVNGVKICVPKTKKSTKKRSVQKKRSPQKWVNVGSSALSGRSSQGRNDLCFCDRQAQERYNRDGAAKVRHSHF
jgi:hypothetical protein